ncbi:zinc finger CCCH domain-containing protein 10-like [Panicum miliaceum]|uniref:Zinc finger CCCH domain-containing protein 10-like n=1 Tax=Panicum miliaceum TaxID=4540 RepID=A0A3L6SXV3_PANMI|nr:zinc finger CCCH domain-containing protein 10-like [Panicum miliaceum]
MSSMTTDRSQRRTTPSGGVHQSDPTAWCAWAHRGHRLWAAMPAAFWLYVYKVQRCPEMSSHDWKACPYAHIGERARRRDPRRFPYLAAPCAEYLASRRQHLLVRTGAAPSCARGLRCRQAHGSFELWLHPARFRTRMCERRVGCPRPICFFAHFPAELRGEEDTVPLVSLQPPPPPRILSAPASLPFLSRDDLIIQAMPSELRLYDGTGAPSSFASPATVAVATVAPVPALLQASPDDEDLAGRSGRGASDEDGCVTDDYAHLDLIMDMVNHLGIS